MGYLALYSTEGPIISNAELTAMGKRMRIRVTWESPNCPVAQRNVLRCLGSMVGFDHVRQYSDSEFFATALGEACAVGNNYPLSEGAFEFHAMVREWVRTLAKARLFWGNVFAVAAQ